MIDVQLAFCSDDLCSIGTCGNDFLCNMPCSKCIVQLAVVLLPWKGVDESLGTISSCNKWLLSSIKVPFDKHSKPLKVTCGYSDIC